MNIEIKRNLGEQPIKKIITDNGVKPMNLVAASTEQITHKMVARACKGRRLTSNAKSKILNALNKAVGKEYSMKELFNY